MQLIREFEEEDNFEHADFELIDWKLSPQIISSIRNHPDRYSWDYICYHRNITEDFMREFQDYLIWTEISFRQKMSKDFIIEFADVINFKLLIRNDKISDDVKDYCRMFL